MKSIVIASLTCAITSMSAHAGIIYSGVLNETFTYGTSSSVQNIAGAQFEFGTKVNTPPPAPPASCAYFAPISNDAAVFMSRTDQFGNHIFSEDETISRSDEYLRGPMTGDDFFGSTYWFYTYSSISTPDGGRQPEVYTGFVVGSGEDRKVGWAHMTIEYSDDALISATLHGWAIATAGTPIMAGQTEAVAVPGAGGLAALIGVAGLRRRRRS